MVRVVQDTCDVQVFASDAWRPAALRGDSSSDVIACLAKCSSRPKCIDRSRRYHLIVWRRCRAPGHTTRSGSGRARRCGNTRTFVGRACDQRYKSLEWATFLLIRGRTAVTNEVGAGRCCTDRGERVWRGTACRSMPASRLNCHPVKPANLEQFNASTGSTNPVCACGLDTTR